MSKDINWDLVDERMTWTADYLKNKDKIWDKDSKIVTKDNMELEVEYTIF